MDGCFRDYVVSFKIRAVNHPRDQGDYSFQKHKHNTDMLHSNVCSNMMTPFFPVGLENVVIKEEKDYLRRSVNLSHQ